MKDVLTVRKSVKLLTKIVAYGAMALWVALLVAILSTPAKAQNISTNPIVEQISNDSYKVILDNGGYYHVDANGVPSGWFKYISRVDGVEMVQTGNMHNGKMVGKVTYTVNGKKMMVRQYDINGILVKSTRIHVSLDTRS